MEQPVKFIWSHDAFRVGEDGPTHEPVEHRSATDSVTRWSLMKIS